MCFRGERRLGVRLRRAQGVSGRDEGKIATGRCLFNMAAREESSLSRYINNALNEGKLACKHHSCTVNNNIFVATSEYPAANFRVNCLAIIIFYKTDSIFQSYGSVALVSLWMQLAFIQTSFMARKQGPSLNTFITTVS